MEIVLIENYSITEWIAFLFIYSFLGWCIESTIVSVSKRKLTNRGFLTGPFLPIYGFGAISILLSTLWVRGNILLVYVCGMIAATCLEYVTGVLMEQIFCMRYWDYSDKKFNVNGYICLKSSLFWGVLSVVLVCVVHVPISAFLKSVPVWLLNLSLVILMSLCVIDAVFAFKNALDFGKLLAYETKLRKELAELTGHISDMKRKWAGKATEKQIRYIARQERKLKKLISELNLVKSRIWRFNMSWLKSFPSATSAKFSEVLEETKIHINIKKKSKKL